jgi:arylformamidase
MQISFQHDSKIFFADLAKPIDISLPLPTDAEQGTNCFYAPPFQYSPVRVGDWIGSVAQGSSVNFYNVQINPHGNGTHTECVGHIAPTLFSINNALRQFHFIAQLVTFYPILQSNDDRIITLAQLQEAIVLTDGKAAEAIVIRTLPNDDTKKTRHYGDTNPPYLQPEALAFLADCGVKHLLLDLPSVDREQDGGQVLAHKAFWQFPNSPRHDATITELVFVANTLKDGFYLLNLQIPSFPTDAAPSKPVLYALSN